MGQPRLAIIIPAFNEENTIPSVLDAIVLDAQPIVVDDGSNDQTAQISEEHGAIVIRHEFNKGYDAALMTGISYAISEKFEYAVTIDADGQHSPTEIAIFLNLLEGGADVVCGYRDSCQRISEAIFSLFGRLLWGIQDPLCGFKGYRLSCVNNFGVFGAYDSVGTELLIRAKKNGLRIINHRVNIENRNGKSSFGNGVKANYRILRALLMAIFLFK